MYRLLLAWTAAAALVGCTLSAAPRPAAPVRVAVSSDAITLLPVQLAQTLGFYRQQGLVVTFTEIQSASKSLDALRPRVDRFRASW
jgi:ABC-type nitrate/sulfonate/bicarbonate transport system substrate-binding protein